LFIDFTRHSFEKYGAKIYRLALLEAGHIAQNLLLTAAALGLAGLPLCGFRDAEISAAAGLDFPQQAVVYAVAIGGMVSPD
jgi:SagB-type dehydrogenase family enzyme